jgi:hypothetical protein
MEEDAKTIATSITISLYNFLNTLILTIQIEKIGLSMRIVMLIYFVLIACLISLITPILFTLIVINRIEIDEGVSAYRFGIVRE